MKSVLYMAWRYLASHSLKAVVLISSIALIGYIPVGLRVLVRQSQLQLTWRAEATPLLIGAKGSPLELALNSLYFSSDVPETMQFSEVRRVAESGLAMPIPLYVRFYSQSDPIVGTTLDYFELRRLTVASGRQMTRLGDCVIGAEVARARSIVPGGHILSSPESVFDLAGVYPLKMRVAGVLAISDSPDDHAIFVDVKTAWIIQGLAHGHADLSRPEAAAAVLRRQGDRIIANASVVQFNEITDENIDSFHFHGDLADFPITSVVAAPHSRKSAAILMGRYLGAEQRLQILQPVDVIDELLATVFTVQHFVVAALVVTAAATLAVAALVFLLSVQLRRREIETMVKIGGARKRIAAILASEILLVLMMGVAIAGALTWATSSFAAEIIRALLIS